jgi:CheY-like chemotaxis protein/nitrogen-specific signal transduction histidine kinase
VIIGASKIARDITEQIGTRRQLAAAYEQLKKAEQMKIEFLATLSHELRTPLNAINLWVQLLEGNHTPADVAEGIAIIGRSVRSQRQLIEDLLDMSRIESGKVSLDMQRLDLPSVASAAMDTVRPAAMAKGIRLTSAFSNLGGVMMGDKNRVQQILWNLLTNAIKFTPKDGQVHVVIERGNSHVEISVTDTGEGIAPEMLEQIFERFRQADASSTRRHGGLGLGLAIAKHLTELHGGTTHASSLGLGKGSSFTVSFPLSTAGHPPAQADSGPPPAPLAGGAKRAELTGVRILVVDDDLDSLSVIRRILENRGAEVRTASAMEEGLAEFDRSTPHVILSDISMPGHDGYELMARLRERPASRGVPAVALTALAHNEDRTRALRAGFQAHMAKPTDSEELVVIVQNLAALRSAP